MKKLGCLFLILILTMTMISGCKSKKAETPTTEGTTKETSDTTESEEATNTGEVEAAEEVELTAISKDDIKIGVIYDSDPAEGTGYNYMQDQGIIGMQKELGLLNNQIIRKVNISDNSKKDIEAAMEDCVKQGCNIIFATSGGYMETSEAFAQKYPNIIFSNAAGNKSNGKNLNSYFGRSYQAKYLAGIAAGLRTQTNNIGYVATWGTDNSIVTSNCDAFAMGVYSVNPNAKVYVKVINSWYKPDAEKQAADVLIGQNRCDVIGQDSNTPNPQLAAEEAGVWGIGYNSDMAADAPSVVLTSTIWNWSVYYIGAVESAINGTWNGTNYYGGMKEGLVDILPPTSLSAEGTDKAIEDVKAKILSGEWDVFTGVIETNKGTTVGVEGKSLDDTTLTSGINWYFKNIVEE